MYLLTIAAICVILILAVEWIDRIVFRNYHEMLESKEKQNEQDSES